MQKISIITDTDSSLPFDLAAQYNIYQIPMTVHFGEESYEAVYAISDRDTFRRIDQEGRLPTTAAPAPGKFIAAYKTAFDAGAEKLICFCVSSEVSATYNAAMAAAESFPGREITVIDSTTLSMGLGFMVLAAAQAASQGATVGEILSVARDTRDRTYLFAALSTLKYLVMGGRISHLSGSVATMLNLKPILTIRNGKLDLLERVRSQRKSWERVIELSARAAGTRQIEKMCILHANAAQMAAEFKSEIQTRMHCPDEMMIAEVTPGLSVHSGAGMVGTVFIVK